MAIELLYALALRFFLIEFKSTKRPRDWFRNLHPLCEKWTDCPFCNGFWCGLFIYWLFHGVDMHLPFFALAAGFASFLVKIGQEYILNRVNGGE